MAHRIEDLSTSAERERELLARFGRAAMQAQLFEHLFATVVGFRDGLRAIDGDSDDLFEESIRRWQSRPAGQALHSLRQEYGHVPEEALEVWTRAVEERNRLMHRFFLEHRHRGNMQSVGGLQAMVDDTDELHDLFVLGARWCADVRGTTVANLQRFVSDAPNAPGQ